MCSSECTECSGHGSNNCDFSTCKNFYDIEGGRCIEKCPSNYFADQSNSPPTCHKCHEDCMKCTGFSNSDCISCRQFKVYYDYGDRKQNTKVRIPCSLIDFWEFFEQTGFEPKNSVLGLWSVWEFFELNSDMMAQRLARRAEDREVPGSSPARD